MRGVQWMLETKVNGYNLYILSVARLGPPYSYMYRRISNNSYTLLIHTPSFSGKRCQFSYSNSFVHVKLKLLFYGSYSKNVGTVRWHFWHLEVRVNTFFLLFVMILQPGMPVKAGVPTKSCKLHPLQCHVEFATNVWFSLFSGKSSIDVGWEGQMVEHVATKKLATCIAYRYTYVDRS